MDHGELADLVVHRERNPDYWRQELDWLLSQDSVGLLSAVCEQGQAGLRCPGVSEGTHRVDAIINPLAGRITPLLNRGTQVCIDLSDVLSGKSDSDCALFRGLLDQLPRAAVSSGDLRGLMFSWSAELPSLPALLHLSLSDSSWRPRVALRVSDDLLGAAYQADGIGFAGSGLDAGSAARLWRRVTDTSHRHANIELVLQTTTHFSCELSVPESPEVVMPVSLFEARAETAWLAIQVNIGAFSPYPDRQRFRALRRALRVGMRLADNLMDGWNWSSKAMRDDAQLNRRLAVHVTGIGDLVDRYAMDPASLNTLRNLERWLAVVKQLMIRESNLLARQRGAFPGLPVKELVGMLTSNFGREAARKLIHQRSMRHRHLMVMSPFSLFPAEPPAHPFAAYCHLLPVIRFADTIAMHGIQGRHRLNADQYHRLLRMTWAIARNRQ